MASLRDYEYQVPICSHVCVCRYAFIIQLLRDAVNRSTKVHRTILFADPWFVKQAVCSFCAVLKPFRNRTACLALL